VPRTTDGAVFPPLMRTMGWVFAAMMLLYPIHSCIVVRADLEFARQHPKSQPESQFDLRTIVMHDTVFGWAGAWGAALGTVWLAGAGGLWTYYFVRGWTLCRRSRRSLIAILTGLLVVGSGLVAETIAKSGVG
jgi:hypothetical protein